MQIGSVNNIAPAAETSGDQNRLGQMFGNGKEPSTATPTDTHLSFTLAAIPASDGRPCRPAMTFRIPRDYVWVDHAYTAEGKLCRVPLRVRLPGATAWHDEAQDTDAAAGGWDQLKLGFPGRYVVNLGTASGASERLWCLGRVGVGQPGPQDLIADGQEYGLSRYSPIQCYSIDELRQPEVKRQLAQKLSNDPSPQLNCRVDREASIYLTPNAAGDEDSMIAIMCSTKGCQANFGVDGRGASVYFSRDELPNWRTIIEPIQALITTFIVRKV